MITSLRLQNFRSYRDESFEFEPGVNIIVGPNGSGKTNLLEAVLVLSRGSSYRARDPDIIMRDKPWARLDGFFGSNNRTVKIKRQENGTDKSFEIEGKLLRRLRLENTVPVVFFEPSHLQIISRGPDTRREYIDDLLERSQPGYKTTLANYRRALAQRNRLLKQSASSAKKQLFAWDVRLSQLGMAVATARALILDDVNKQISRSYSQIAGKKTVIETKYCLQFPVELYASKMLAKLQASVATDFVRGFTGSGPHREDIEFFINSEPLSTTGSRGEARSLLLALKIFELELIAKARGQKPIFLLDDVFSELDSARRRALVDYLSDYQTIITTTDADAVIEYFAGSHNLIPLQ